MPINPDILQDVLQRMQTRRYRDEAVLQERRVTVMQKIPELGEVEQAIRGLLLGLFGGGHDTAAIQREHAALVQRRSALLRANGYPSDILEPVVYCPKCNDTGYCESATCGCVLQIHSRHPAKAFRF